MGSRSGSMSCLTTICATRSATVGTPKILSPPDFLEMETSRTGAGKELSQLIPFPGLSVLSLTSTPHLSSASRCTPAAAHPVIRHLADSSQKDQTLLVLTTL